MNPTSAPPLEKVAAWKPTCPGELLGAHLPKVGGHGRTRAHKIPEADSSGSLASLCLPQRLTVGERHGAALRRSPPVWCKGNDNSGKVGFSESSQGAWFSILPAMAEPFKRYSGEPRFTLITSVFSFVSVCVHFLRRTSTNSHLYVSAELRWAGFFIFCWFYCRSQQVGETRSPCFLRRLLHQGR